MERVQVPAPSFLTAHRYFELTKELAVEFGNGQKWKHANVPAGLYEQFAASLNPFAFWAASIRQPRATEGRKEALYPVTGVTYG
jgi:hypothetical protein